MRTYYLTVSVGQKSKHGVAEFSAQGYTGLQSKLQPSVDHTIILIWTSVSSSSLLRLLAVFNSS